MMRDYVRFVILTTGRSGSTWLVEALNSHDEIVCFGSLFEVNADYVSFDTPGYDNFDAAAISQPFRAFSGSLSARAGAMTIPRRNGTAPLSASAVIRSVCPTWLR